MCVVGAQSGMERRQEIAGEGYDSKRRGDSRIQSTTVSCEGEHAIEQIVAKTGCDARYEAYESDRLVERAKDDAQAYVSRLLMSEGCLLGLMADVFARKVLVHVELKRQVDRRGEYPQLADPTSEDELYASGRGLFVALHCRK